METLRWIKSLGLMIALGWLASGSSARADTDAVTVSAFGGGGFIAGGAAFSFTPTTNLLVTRVGYQQNDTVNPIITFWSNTNYPFAAYPLIHGLVNGQMVY